MSSNEANENVGPIVTKITIGAGIGAVVGAGVGSVIPVVAYGPIIGAGVGAVVGTLAGWRWARWS
jgi:uncharacterized membrane protein